MVAEIATSRERPVRADRRSRNANVQRSICVIPAQAGIQAYWTLLEIAKRRQDFAVEQFVMQGEQKAINAQVMEVSHPAQNRIWRSNKTTGKAFIRVKLRELILTRRLYFHLSTSTHVL